MIASSFLFTIFASIAAACVSDIQSHSSVSSCYVLHAGSVYDLTSWVSSGHPGKSAPILPYCGKSDASFDAKYTAQHAAKDFSSSGATLLGSLCPPPVTPATPSVNAAAGSAAPKPSSSVSITSIAKATTSSVAVSVTTASKGPSTQSTPCSKAAPTATAVPITDAAPSMYMTADATSTADASAATTASSDVYSSAIGSKAEWSHLVLVSVAAIMAAASI